VLADAAVVYADAAEAGETLQEFWLSFPAATARNTPELARLFAVVFSDVERPPPSDMFATAGLTAFARTQSSARMIPDVEPEPEQFRTRTPRSCTDLATP
jgi:hypothetical protein